MRLISSQISRASAGFLMTGGLALLFAADEILPRIVPGFPAAGSWIGQLVGAGWLAAAALNWLGRSALIGGIYGRPLLMANLSLYFISAMVLLRVAAAGTASAGLWFFAVTVAIFAGVYAALLFRGPPQRDLETHRPKSTTLSIIVGGALAFGGILSCQDLTGPLPNGSVPLQPPPVFQLWWSQTQACSGQAGAFSDVDWYVVLGGDGTSYWQPEGNRILLAGQSWLDGDVVRHEMLHALLAVSAPAHPRDQFLGRCRGVVICTSGCQADAGPAPPMAATETITPEALELSAEVTPRLAGAARFSPHFSVIVRVRNSANHPVFLHLPPSGEGMTFGVRLIGPRTLSGTVHRSDAVDTVFAAGETKQHIFDFAVGDPPQPYEVHTTPDRIVVPGAYRVEFGYADRLTILADELFLSR